MAIMTMLADHAARQLLDFNQKLDINLLDNVVNCLYHGEGAQYYGLQILENVIKTRWKILPRNQCEGIKKYVVGLIIKTSSDPSCVEKEKVYIGKLNMILVQILKQEWPKHWPTFISDIVGASRTSESLCQNNMVILKLLSEEVFDFSSGQITQFLNVPMFRNVSLKCLTEIAGVSVSQYEEQFVTLFTLTMMQLKQMLPLNTNIRLAYSNGKDDEQNFIQNLSLFLCTFLKEHGLLIEKRLNLRETLMEGKSVLNVSFSTAFRESTLRCSSKETALFACFVQVYLTHLDYADTERIMTEKLHNQVNGTEWSWKNLNTLCWAIGSISGAMHEEDEKRFLVTVIKVQVGEVMPFIDEILNNINTIICDLQPQQVHTFYEAVGYMIGAQTDQTVQEHLIEKYMLLPNQVWDSIIQQATKVAENFVPPLLDAVLIDYQRNVPAAREPEVLSTMAIIVNKLGGHITAEIPQIFDAVFECTLNMINKDFEEYPEHRTNFFLLLQAVNSQCFPAFLAIPPAQFKLVLDSIIWAFKHTMRNVADTGLQILYTLLQNVAQEETAAQSFYQTYFCDILQHIFSVVTDTSHTAGENVPVKLFVTGLFSLNQDIPAFKEHLRDFLVQIKEFAGEDTSDLFLEERETALRQAQEEKHKLQMSVPGILNPHEIPEEIKCYFQPVTDAITHCTD
ncbi:hypothetical protein IHE44_0008779 [Lamprotornis superbus]|uniref:Exportin-1 C-terminal domain-containing protein n=1 Tax=Lamprotornis superbus TaxID=245042 RepID=A0A835NYX3_9PASS|nr:hypothetical protein IHE44_0008779 [Lamprotornis superbus]